MNGRLIRVLTMTHRIITLLQACNWQGTDNCADVLHFQRFPCRPPARRIPAIPRPVLVVTRRWAGGRRHFGHPDGAFHFISLSRQLLFVFGQGFGSSPSSSDSLTPSLARSLHPSIAADRFLKRSERRWAAVEDEEGGGVATSLPPSYLALRSNLGGLKPAMFRFLSVWKLTERH